MEEKLNPTLLLRKQEEKKNEGTWKKGAGLSEVAIKKLVLYLGEKPEEKTIPGLKE